jgi:hypothetical protein
MVPKELTVRYKGSVDGLYHWYRDQYPTLLRAMGTPFTNSTADDSKRSVACQFARLGGNSATFTYTVTAGDEFEGEPTAIVRLDTEMRKALLFGRGFETKMLGLFMTTDQLVGQYFPVVPQDVGGPARAPST